MVLAVGAAVFLLITLMSVGRSGLFVQREAIREMVQSGRV